MEPSCSCLREQRFIAYPLREDLPSKSRGLTRLGNRLFMGSPGFCRMAGIFCIGCSAPDKQHEGLYIGTLDSGELRPLLPLRTHAEYANGYLFFGRRKPDGAIL
jgi:hypothetical protein